MQKLISSLELPTAFNKSFKVTSVSFFIHDSSLSNCELDNFTCYIESIHTDVILKWNK